jgi:hypothetical protein
LNFHNWKQALPNNACDCLETCFPKLEIDRVGFPDLETGFAQQLLRFFKTGFPKVEI